MKIKVISYGVKNKIRTAEIVVAYNGKSRTVHVWHRYVNVYGDYIGNNYELPK